MDGEKRTERTECTENLTQEAHGGMNEFYAAAHAKYAYSERLKNTGWRPDDEQRLLWLADTISAMQRLHLAQLHLANNLESAVQTRRLLAEMLDEMGELLRKAKDGDSTGTTRHHGC